MDLLQRKHNTPNLEAWTVEPDEPQKSKGIRYGVAVRDSRPGVNLGYISEYSDTARDLKAHLLDVGLLTREDLSFIR
jgi:hypothetical protein